MLKLACCLFNDASVRLNFIVTCGTIDLWSEVAHVLIPQVQAYQ